jgi:hypothetical protein
MTFVTSDGVEQVADIYVVDICEADDRFPDGSSTRKAMFMGWHALHRQGLEARTWDEWFPTVKNPPAIDLEEADSPKD